MSALAVALILAAAVFHAGWNLLAKRAGGGLGFSWLFFALSTLLYLPVMIGAQIITPTHLGRPQLVAILVTAVLHIGYFGLLQRGYSVGDMSVVYPLARGTGPLLSTIIAIAVLHEHTSSLALAGAAAVIAGVFLLSGGPSMLRGGSSVNAAWAVRYGLLTGAVIAAYTLWDKRAVGTLAIPPLVLDWSANAARTVLLAPLALRRRGEVADEWRRHRREALGIAIASPAAYILVLTALRFSPVSRVAPAREVSILVGAWFGVRFLGEKNGRTRMVASAVIVAGVLGLAFG